jgi:maleate cis-trans isomerase
MSDAAPLRVGLIVPASNTTMARELSGWLPPGSDCLIRPIAFAPVLLTPAVLPAYLEAAVAAARELPAGLDVIAYGCTAAGFLGGAALDADLAGRIAAATGLPVVTAAGAMVAELLALGLRRVDLVTPYGDAVNAGLVAFLAGAAIAVGRIERLCAPDVAALCRLTAEDVATAARGLAGSAGEGVFIACTQLPTASVLGPLRQACGKPVLSSNQATAARVLWTARQGAHRSQARGVAV